DRPDPAILDAKALDEGLERTVLAVVSEVGTKDVEWDALAGGVGGVGKCERRVRITETLDEPRRPDPVDVRARTRHPRAAARRQRCPMASAGRPWPLPGRTQPLGCRFPERMCALARRRFQVVNRLHPVKLVLEGIESAPQLRRRAVVVCLGTV